MIGYGFPIYLSKTSYYHLTYYCLLFNLSTFSVNLHVEGTYGNVPFGNLDFRP